MISLHFKNVSLAAVEKMNYRNGKLGKETVIDNSGLAVQLLENQG